MAAPSSTFFVGHRSCGGCCCFWGTKCASAVARQRQRWPVPRMSLTTTLVAPPAHLVTAVPRCPRWSTCRGLLWSRPSTRRATVSFSHERLKGECACHTSPRSKPGRTSRPSTPSNVPAACWAPWSSYATPQQHKYWAGQLAPCDHKIRVLGNEEAYEIGVVRSGDKWELNADFFVGGTRSYRGRWPERWQAAASLRRRRGHRGIPTQRFRADRADRARQRRDQVRVRNLNSDPGI